MSIRKKKKKNLHQKSIQMSLTTVKHRNTVFTIGVTDFD